MKAPDEIANDVTAMPNTTISGERMRRDSMTATFAAEKTSAPPSIVRRTAGWPPIGESATIATATSTRTNSPIHQNHSRAVEYFCAASAGRRNEREADDQKTCIDSRCDPDRGERPKVRAFAVISVALYGRRQFVRRS